jgi:peptide-methionine (S)-S-oxide reductase
MPMAHEKKNMMNFLHYASRGIFLLACLMCSSSLMAEEEMGSKPAVAIFAGGCFWCMEPAFDTVPGVINTVSGYTGGHIENPTYKAVSKGKTGHSEAIQVTYDPEKVSYEQLLQVFWHNIDPFNNQGQFCDKGEQYRATIFYQDDEQKQLAEASKDAIAEQLQKQFSAPIVTSITPASKFYPAEDYHQNYYKKNPKTYKFYRFTCGRDRRLNQIWQGN